MNLDSTLRRLVFLTVGIGIIIGILPQLPRALQGDFFLFHGSALLLAGVVIFRRKIVNELSTSNRLALALIFILWGTAEFGWGSSYFLMNLSSRLPAAVLATQFGYTGSFLAGICALVLALEEPFWKWVKPAPAIISLIASTPVAVRLILNPFMQNKQTEFWAAFNIGETTSICSSFVLINLALLVFFSSRDLRWSLVSAGIISTVFGDWGMRVDKILGNRPALNIYSGMVLFGLYSSAMALLTTGTIRRIERYSRTSLITSFRLGAMSTVLIGLVIFAAANAASLGSLKIMTTGCAAAAFIAVIFSHFQIERLQRFTQELANLLKLEMRGEFDKLKAVQTEEMPAELNENYELIFARLARSERLEQDRRLGQIAAQVAHDIKSPVSTLRCLLTDLNTLPDEPREILYSAVERITRIADELLHIGKSCSLPPTRSGQDILPLQPILEEIIAQKKIELQVRQEIAIVYRCRGDAFDCYASLDKNELARAVSNIINNAVEAMNGRGCVRVTLHAATDNCVIEIADDGAGIPLELLSTLGERGVTHGKANGSGLGLHQAKTAIAGMGGALLLDSLEGIGTVVRLHLPRCEAPGIFASRSDLELAGDVIIIEQNSETIDGLAKLVRSTSQHVFHSPTDFVTAVESNPGIVSPNAWFVVGETFQASDLGGLKLIRMFGLRGRSIVLCQRISSQCIAECLSIGAKMLPISMIRHTQQTHPEIRLPMDSFYQQTYNGPGPGIMRTNTGKNFPVRQPNIIP